MILIPFADDIGRLAQDYSRTIIEYDPYAVESSAYHNPMIRTLRQQVTDELRDRGLIGGERVPLVQRIMPLSPLSAADEWNSELLQDAACVAVLNCTRDTVLYALDVPFHPGELAVVMRPDVPALRAQPEGAVTFVYSSAAGGKDVAACVAMCCPFSPVVHKYSSTPASCYAGSIKRQCIILRGTLEPEDARDLCTYIEDTPPSEWHKDIAMDDVCALGVDVDVCAYRPYDERETNRLFVGRRED